VRYSFNSDDTACNRWKQSEPPTEPHALNPVPCRCIASQCMAWRWCPDLKEMADGTFWLTTNDKTLDGIAVQRADAIGYCGLSGKPDGEAV
jgi:hypothetical protein